MARRDKRKGEENAKASVDFGLGSAMPEPPHSWGGLFEGIQKLVEAAAGLKESGGVDKTGEFAIPGLGEKGKGIFGFSIRTLAGGNQPSVKVQPFGNIHQHKEGMVVEEAREPVVDIFEEGDCIRVIAELPGVSKSDIKYEIDGDVLTLSTEGNRAYRAEVLLPAAVQPGDVELSYTNGILELKLKKAEDS